MTRISVYLCRQNGQLTLDQNSGGDLVPVLSVAGTIDVIGRDNPSNRYTLRRTFTGLAFEVKVFVER